MRTRFRKPLLYPLSYGGASDIVPASAAWEDRAMTDTAAIAELLHEAAETHHVVYRIVDGDDPDWASWYADWLITLSELPQLLGGAPVRSHLVHALVQLDRDYTAEPRELRWEDWYAERLASYAAG
jgi:hypothetical protein